MTLRTFADGDILTQQAIHAHMRGEGGAWRYFNPEAWQGGLSTPTYDSSTSRYAQFGMTVMYVADIKTTHSSAVGYATCPMAIRLPVPAVAPQVAFGNISYRAGATTPWYHGVPLIEDPEWASFLAGNSTDPDGIGGDSTTYNSNLAVGSRWWVAIMYEAAE